MNTVLVMARLTFREAVRRKIVMASLILGVLFLILFGTGFYLIHHEFTDPSYLQQPVTPIRYQQQGYNYLFLAGMYIINFLGAITAALITADSLAGEIQSGTIQAVVTKPILRSGVVLGKWLGQAILLLLYLLMLGGGVVLIVNLIAGYIPPNWYSGLALIYFNSLIIMSLTLAFSSSLSTLATGGAVFGAYGIAFLGGWVERVGTLLQNQTTVNLGIFSSLLLPSEAVWNKAANLMTSPLINLSGISPFSSSSEPSPIMMAYAGLYLLILIGIAVARFTQRDL